MSNYTSPIISPRGTNDSPRQNVDQHGRRRSSLLMRLVDEEKSFFDREQGKVISEAVASPSTPGSHRGRPRRASLLSNSNNSPLSGPMTPIEERQQPDIPQKTAEVEYELVESESDAEDAE
ncbi:hypothetical protein J8273_2349 [Carpediemonas membranifera]|uniref:Uncharacterized protein n=1 Tax=Carpediemonas membranifera TaxID=201153 RepID=A0A8J6B0U5_9EUKA|nr:hypothetical protein J8273_2349 [Carpediemonas membranifera]|eukprot:KAG9396000.1 hypothetical protein J8273_2349 [Carpediemonas membranifera]